MLASNNSINKQTLVSHHNESDQGTLNLTDGFRRKYACVGQFYVNLMKTKVI